MTFKRAEAAVYGPAGQVAHTRFVRAGRWVFGTGLRATLADGRMDPAVVRADHPLAPPPKAQREAGAIFAAMEAGLASMGSSLSCVARLDQYYTSALAVDPYHVARKSALAGQVAPSTSVIVGGLLNTDALMDVQVMACTSASGYTAERLGQDRLSVPSTSGYAPCLRVGDMLFIAGQLARDHTGAIAPGAKLPPGQQWSGTRIKLETAYVVRERLLPALEAAGSGLDLVLKAQVYLSRTEDFPAFWQAWSEAFGGRIPPTTVVPVVHPAFGTEEATIEVNLVAAHGSARDRVEDIVCDVALIGPGCVPACRFDDLLFVAGLMALDENGLCAAARTDASAPYYADSAHEQMVDVLGKARTIFAAAGADLSTVVRALQFQSRLEDLPALYRAWDQEAPGAGQPFTAVQVAPQLFVPGARVILDLWGYAPR
jgi:enamine deaminase RidA (YjgF/YER057c/UK114 family)